MTILNLSLITLPLSCSWFFYYAVHLQLLHPIRVGVTLTFLFFLLYYLIGSRTYDGFRFSFYRISELCQSQFLSYLIADTVLFVVLCLMSDGFPPVLPALTALILQMVFSVLWCIATNRWYSAHYEASVTAVVHDGSSSFEQTILRYKREERFNVVGKYTIKECLAEPSLLDGVETVFLDSSHTRQRDDIINLCLEKQITCFLIPMVNDAVMSSAEQAHMMYTPMLRVKRFRAPIEYRLPKRLLDILASLALLILFSPLMAVLALLIRRDGGPALFRQKRLTLNGRVFTLIKFRSMIVDAEKHTGAILSSGENDPRVTKIGRFIRACRLDELPQLINILKGDMSFVGPRPERVENYEAYCKDLPEFRLRLQVRAGLTGLAQVYGRYNTPPREKLTMDLYYIAHASLGEDLRIFFATLIILFRKESTEGFTENEPGEAEK